MSPYHSDRESIPRVVLWIAAMVFVAILPRASAQGESAKPTAGAKNLVLVEKDDGARRFAVVVGLDQDGLRYAERDARDVAAALKSAGWAATTLVQTESDGKATGKAYWPQDPDAIVSVIEKVVRKARKDDTLLFYFSGHGVEFEREIYLSTMVIDRTSPEAIQRTGLALERVHRALAAGECQRTLVILDACRKDPSKKFTPVNGFSPQTLARTIGTGILYSTAPGLSSFEPSISGMRDHDGKPIENGFFTHFLLRGLAGEARLNSDAFLTFKELAMYVGDAMARFTTEHIEYAEEEPFMKWDGTVHGDLLIRELTGALEPRVPDPKVFTALPEFGVDTKTGYAKAIRNTPTGIVLRLIPAGTFRMGSPGSESQYPSESPQHSIEITKPFYLGETEVTIGQWRAYSITTAAKTEAEQSDGGFTLIGSGKDTKLEKHASAIWTNPLPEQGFRPSDDHPLTQVSWNDAQGFCRRFGFALPTEAEWEYACRAGSTTTYFWGDSASLGIGLLNGGDLSLLSRLSFGEKEMAFPFDDGFPLTAPVGSFRPNAFGLRDMLGNVREWCRDGYNDYKLYSERAKVITRDPQFTWPVDQSWRDFVARGGSCFDTFKHTRSASRSGEGPNYCGFDVGFRVARYFQVGD